MALYSTVVRYGKMGHTARVASESPDFDLGDPCILRTDRGTEWGTVTSIPRPAEDLRKLSNSKILRPSDERDHSHLERIPEMEREVMGHCDRLLEEHQLNMQVVGTEVLFGGEQVVVYFQAEGRVDFRSLVRDLSDELATRVEMRQLGDREVARLLGDVGVCGLTLCCKSHLKKFQPVTMKMARIQMSSLQAEKLSGACGRLKCCLRYEFETYQELLKQLPKKKKKISLPDGRQAIILDHDILKQEIFVLLDGERRWMTAGDWLELSETGCASGGGCSDGGCGR